MPLFYFHLVGDNHVLDLEGVDLVDASEARLEAVRAAGHMLTDSAQDICGGAPWAMRVTDDANAVVLNLRFMATST